MKTQTPKPMMPKKKPAMQMPNNLVPPMKGKMGKKAC